MRKKHLLERKAALQADVEARLAKTKAANDNDLEMDFTAELAAVDKLQDELKTINVDLASIEALEERIRKGATLPESGTSRTGRVEVRSSKLDEPWESFGHFLLAVRDAEGNMRAGRPIDERLASGFNEGVGSEGAFLVGTDNAGPLIEQIFDTGAVLSRCRTIPISSSSNGVRIPALADKTRTDGNRAGGVSVYWAAEAAQYTGTTPKPFERVELELKKLTGLVYATDELLADASAINAWINAALPEEMSFVLENNIIRGIGGGLPLGILNAACLVTQTKEGSQTATTVNVKNLTKMWARMPARLKARAVWFINADVFPQFQLMTSDTTSAAQMVWMPPGGVSGAPYGTIFGRPVLEIEYASTLGTVGDVILADFSQYALARKGGVQQQSSMHVRFLYDETAFKFTMRVDGKPLWNDKITPKNGSMTQSPFVVLETRS